MGYVARGTNRLCEWGPVLSKERTILLTEYERSGLLPELPEIANCVSDYGGISAERLEILEERLRDDVVSELHSFGGKYAQPFLSHGLIDECWIIRLLLHTETVDGSVIPVWEEVRPGHVASMKDVMSACKESNISVDVFYRRVPITAERQPDFSDFSELIAVMLGPHMTHTPIVVNDQLGRGRSTLTSVSAT